MRIKNIIGDFNTPLSSSREAIRKHHTLYTTAEFAFFSGVHGICWATKQTLMNE